MVDTRPSQAKGASIKDENDINDSGVNGDEGDGDIDADYGNSDADSNNNSNNEQLMLDGSPVEGPTKHIMKLEKGRWYVALGKGFAIKWWPWPSDNWWINNEDSGEPEDETRDIDSRDEFRWYLEVMSIEETEWMTRSFKTSVMVLVHILKLNLTICK